jgi:hypothetical protein
VVGENKNESQVQNALNEYIQRGERIEAEEFQVYLQSDLDEQIKPSDFYLLLKFVSDQCAHWSAEWYFSAQSAPDFHAMEESERWSTLRHGLVSVMEQYVDVSAEELEGQHNLTLLQESMRRRVEYNKSRPTERMYALFSGWVALQLNKIGLRSIANTIYTKSLYPKGSIGRNT